MPKPPRYNVQIVYELTHPDGKGEHAEYLNNEGHTRLFRPGSTQRYRAANFKTAAQAERRAASLGFRHFRVWEIDAEPDAKGSYAQRIARYIQPHTQTELAL